MIGKKHNAESVEAVHTAFMISKNTNVESAEVVHTAFMISKNTIVKNAEAVHSANMVFEKQIVKSAAEIQSAYMVFKNVVAETAVVLDSANMVFEKQIVKSAADLTYVNHLGAKRQQLTKTTKATACPASSTILKMLGNLLLEITRQKRSLQLIILRKFILILIGWLTNEFKMAVLVVVLTCYWIWVRILSSWK
jgi:hypothetical protein